MDSRIAHWLSVKVRNDALRNALFIALLPAIILDALFTALYKKPF